MSDVLVHLVAWLWPASLAFTVVTIALLLGHRKLLAWFGARTLYRLWLLLPLALGLPVIARLSAPVFSLWFSAEQQATWQSWTALPGAQVLPPEGSADINLRLTLLAAIWLVPMLIMLGLFIHHYLFLRRQPTAHYKGLKVQWQAVGSSPGIAGLLTPRLQLPLDFAHRFSRREQGFIIQHELTHWRRGDQQSNALAWLLLASQWFNPLAWKAYQRFRADQELACDASVLNGEYTRRPEDFTTKQVCYANALLAAMQSVSLNAHPRNLWSTAACTHIAQGEKAMAQERFNQLNQHHQLRRWPAWCAATLVTLAGLAWFAPVTADTAGLHDSAETPPAAQPIVRVQPNYPEAAVEQGIEGYVDLSFVITDSGTVSDVEVLRAEPEDIFNEVAVAALERWRFVPQDNLPQQIRLQFELDND